MKVLLDSCIGVRVRRALQDAGHDVAWVADLGPDPGDELVLARAFEEGRVLITMDADYGVLAVVEQKPHAGIIRLLVDEPLMTADVEKVRIRKGQSGQE